MAGGIALDLHHASHPLQPIYTPKTACARPPPMAPPPPLKFGQRELFNDSFLSFLRRNNNKQQQLGPPGGPPPHTPDSQEPLPIPNGNGNGHAPAHANGHAEAELAEKKALWQDGMVLLDRTKDLLEQGAPILGKDTTKKLRKEAAK